eukprot:NODE_6_length_48303_cov_0.387022.p4 type:complete len:970 gc:universal NODE_6_length_48303_cov_0.387022:46540-43631(-)
MTIPPVAQLLQNLATSSDPDLHFIALSDLLLSVKNQEPIQLLDSKQTRQVLQLLTSHQADIVQMTIKSIPLMDVSAVTSVLDDLYSNEYEEIIVMCYQTLIKSRAPFDPSWLSKFISWKCLELIIQFCEQYKSNLKIQFDDSLITYLSTLDSLDKQYLLLEALVNCVPSNLLQSIIHLTLERRSSDRIQSRLFYSVLSSILRRDISSLAQFHSILHLPLDLHEDNILDGCALIDMFHMFVPKFLTLFNRDYLNSFINQLNSLCQFSMDEGMLDDDFGFDDQMDSNYDSSWQIRLHAIQLLSRLLIRYPDFDSGKSHDVLINSLNDQNLQIRIVVANHYLSLSSLQFNKLTSTQITNLIDTLFTVLINDPNNDELLLLVIKAIPYSVHISKTFNLFNSTNPHYYTLFSLLLKHSSPPIEWQSTLLTNCLNSSKENIVMILEHLRLNNQLHESLYPVTVSLLGKIIDSNLATVAIWYPDLIDVGPLLVNLLKTNNSIIIDILQSSGSKLFFDNWVPFTDEEWTMLFSMKPIEPLLPFILEYLKYASANSNSISGILFYLINQNHPMSNYSDYYKLLPFIGDKTIMNYLFYMPTSNSDELELIKPHLTDALYELIKSNDVTNFSAEPSELLLFYTSLANRATAPIKSWSTFLMSNEITNIAEICAIPLNKYTLKYTGSRVNDTVFMQIYEGLMDVKDKLVFLLNHKSADLSFVKLCDKLADELDVGESDGFNSLAIHAHSLLSGRLNLLQDDSLVNNTMLRIHLLKVTKQIDEIFNTTSDLLEFNYCKLEIIMDAIINGLIKTELGSLFEYLRLQTNVNAKYIRVLDMGLMKIKIDDGLTNRKLAYACLQLLVELNMANRDYVIELLSKGLKDIEQVRQSAIMVLMAIDNEELKLEDYRPLLLELLNQIKNPPKLAKLTQDREKTINYLKVGLRVFYKIESLKEDVAEIDECLLKIKALQKGPYASVYKGDD